MTEPLDALLTDLLGALQESLAEGAAALFGAMTERARAQLVDVAGTERALGNELLAPLVGHQQHGWDAWAQRGEAARTRFWVSGGSAPAVYLVSLRHDSRGNWRITGLRRDDLPWS